MTKNFCQRTMNMWCHNIVKEDFVIFDVEIIKLSLWCSSSALHISKMFPFTISRKIQCEIFFVTGLPYFLWLGLDFLLSILVRGGRLSNNNVMSMKMQTQIHIEDGKMGMRLGMDSSTMGRPLVSHSRILDVD